MRYTWLAGLVLGGVPAMAPAGGIHVRLGLPSIGIGIGGGHYYHSYYRPAFYGGWGGPSVYFGTPYYYAPPVVYSAPPVVYAPPPQPTVVYATPPQTYAQPTYVPQAGAPQYAPAPQQQYAPQPQYAPAPVAPSQPAPSYYYGQ